MASTPTPVPIKFARTLDFPPRALSTLRAADPALAALIRRLGSLKDRIEIENVEGPLASLVRAIVYQQLSGRAAATIYGRLRAQFPARRFPRPDELLALSDETLRTCGLSQAKVRYLRDLAARASDGRLELHTLAEQSDEEVITALSSVHGIGRWSAQMFLIFHLGRLDVWPEADLGIRKAVMDLHGLPALPGLPAMRELAARYSPYASIASVYLWRSLDEAGGDAV